MKNSGTYTPIHQAKHQLETHALFSFGGGETYSLTLFQHNVFKRMVFRNYKYRREMGYNEIILLTEKEARFVRGVGKKEV